MEDNRKIFTVHNLGIINLTKYKGKLKTMSGMQEPQKVNPVFSEETWGCTSKKKKVAENQESELKATISGLKTIVL